MEKWKNIASIQIIDKNIIIKKDDYEYKLKDKNKFSRSPRRCK